MNEALHCRLVWPFRPERGSTNTKTDQLERTYRRGTGFAKKHDAPVGKSFQG